MKILRVRRGFTTNSSASSEWVPPQWTPGAKLPPPPGSAIGSSGPSATSPSGTPLAQPTTPLSSEPAQVPSQPHSNLASNGLAVGGLLAAVALVFAAERLMRRIFRPKTTAEVDDE